MTNPLWAPSERAIAESELTRFVRWLAEKYQLHFDDYAALHRWSVEAPDAFWSAYWAFSKVIYSVPPERTVDDLERFPGARWFPETRLSFAENLLAERSDDIAFVSLMEGRARTTMSYAELFASTQQLAATFAALVGEGDRIAGWLPNTTHAAIGMLAASALGAVWSSCSPDFGTSGALDRFGQIAPRVLIACDGYRYAGKVIDTVDKVREVAAAVESIELIIWVSIIGTPLELQAEECLWEDALKVDAPSLEFIQLPFDHPLYILYSSGTTGVPKCIVHGQGGTLLQHRKEHQLHLDLTKHDRLFFFTTCGWMMWNWLISALATRCTVVLYDGSPMHPTPAAMFDIAEQEAVTVFGISAKFLSGAQKQGIRPAETHDLSAMRMLISTGSPLTHEGFRYVYEDIEADCHLVSMSGGTDIISCFMIGNPNLPVYEGELQCAGLGMAVEIWNEAGHHVTGEKGELVCTSAFPSCPVGFWNDPDDVKFLGAYFDQYPNVWVHGDYAEQTEHGGYIIHGRSDAVLNPGGVRIGTAEIYRQVEHFDAIVDAVCIGQAWDDDVRVVLFVVLREGSTLDNTLVAEIKQRIRDFASPRHTPAVVAAVPDIPRTMSGKIAELAVRDAVHGRAVKNTSALANPEALAYFSAFADESDRQP